MLAADVIYGAMDRPRSVNRGVGEVEGEVRPLIGNESDLRNKALGLVSIYSGAPEVARAAESTAPHVGREVDGRGGARGDIEVHRNGGVRNTRAPELDFCQTLLVGVVQVEESAAPVRANRNTVVIRVEPVVAVEQIRPGGGTE